jgi:uncharacterized protein (TIGR02147 family)
MATSLPDSRPLREFLDYREYVREWYEARHRARPLFSLRSFAAKVGLDASFLHRLMKGERHVSEDGAKVLIHFFGLAGDDAEYFRRLVAYARARSDKEAREQFEVIQGMRGVRRRTLAEHRYWSQWWIPAVRSMLSIVDLREDFASLGAGMVPPLEESLVREAIDTLQEMGLARRDEEGCWRPVEAHLQTGLQTIGSETIREFHRQSLGLALRAIDEIPPEERYVGAITFSVDGEGYADLVEMIREFRVQVRERIDECEHPDRVVQLNFQMVPLGRRPSVGEVTS